MKALLPMLTVQRHTSGFLPSCNRRVSLWSVNSVGHLGSIMVCRLRGGLTSANQCMGLSQVDCASQLVDVLNGWTEAWDKTQ